MAYCSTTSIILIVPGLADTSTMTDVILRHITRADALINAKISKRYVVPITPTPPLLGSLSEDITSAYTYRSFYQKDNLNKSEYYGELTAEAFATLDEIRDGKMDLVDASGGVIAESTVESDSGVIDSTTKDYQSFFDVDDELNHHFDADDLNAVRDKR
jgi:hypothetical protein